MTSTNMNSFSCVFISLNKKPFRTGPHSKLFPLNYHPQLLQFRCEPLLWFCQLNRVHLPLTGPHRRVGLLGLLHQSKFQIIIRYRFVLCKLIYRDVSVWFNI